MKADPLLSKGARIERESFRAHLTKALDNATTPDERSWIMRELNWVNGRRRRYNKKPGGLGK